MYQDVSRMGRLFVPVQFGSVHIWPACRLSFGVSRMRGGAAKVSHIKANHEWLHCFCMRPQKRACPLEREKSGALGGGKSRDPGNEVGLVHVLYWYHVNKALPGFTNLERFLVTYNGVFFFQ